MKKYNDSFGIILAVVTGIALLAQMLVRAFWPRMILPRMDVSALVLICLVALVLEHYLIRNTQRNVWMILVSAAVIFGFFPWIACFLVPVDALKLALLGAAVATVCTVLFDNMLERLSSGPAAKAAPLISAFTLYLATQCLMGII